MGLVWKTDERDKINGALRRFSAESGKCAALARVVFSVAKRGDLAATGIQVRPRGSARYIQTKHPRVYYWHSHTLVRTRAHHVDALTGRTGARRRHISRRIWHTRTL